MKMLKAKKAPEKIDPRGIQEEYSISHLESNLSKKGIVFFEPGVCLDIDSSFLSLPKEITEVPSRDLGEYLNAYTQQKVYCRTLLGRASILLEEAQRDYYVKSLPFYKKYSEGKYSETAKERMIISEEEVREEYFKYSDARKRVEILNNVIANIEDIIFMISREVTRRTGDFNEENRAHNVGRK